MRELRHLVELEEEPSRDGFNTFLALLIAVISITAAVTAWRLSVASGEAGEQDSAGLTAALNGEQARTLAAEELYSEYSAFTNYARYDGLGDLIDTDQQNASGDQASALDRQKREDWDIALGIQGTFFNTGDLTPDGNFDLQRKNGEAIVSNARDLDVDDQAHFDKADDARSRARLLGGAFIVLAASLLMVTVARKSSGSRLRYVLTGLGIVVLVSGVTMAAVVDRMV